MCRRGRSDQEEQPQKNSVRGETDDERDREPKGMPWSIARNRSLNYGSCLEHRLVLPTVAEFAQNSDGGWHALSLRRAWNPSPVAPKTTPFEDSGRATQPAVFGRFRLLAAEVQRPVAQGRQFRLHGAVAPPEVQGHAHDRQYNRERSAHQSEEDIPRKDPLRRSSRRRLLKDDGRPDQQVSHSHLLVVGLVLDLLDVIAVEPDRPIHALRFFQTLRQSHEENPVRVALGCRPDHLSLVSERQAI